MRREPPSRTSLLVRNIPRNVTAEDIRYHAEKHGSVRDVYLPKDYYTGEPRGIGFLEFASGRDAEDAKHGLDGLSFNGRQISCVFALQGRKRPDDYRRARGPERRYGGGGGGGGGRRRSYSRSPRRSGSRSPRRRSASRSPRRSVSRSRSPPKRSYSRRSVSRSPNRDEYRRPATRSPPPRDSRSPPRSRARSDDDEDYDRRD